MADRPRRWTARARDRILENWGYKLLSLAIAVGAWLYVQAGLTTEAKLRAVVDWRLPPRLTTTEPLPTTVTVTVRGSRIAIRRAERAELKLRADLSDAKMSEYRVDFASLEASGVPSGVTITGFSPSSVRFALDELSTKKIRITPLTVGDPAEGYSLIVSTVDPQVVQVTGPRSAMGDLRAVSTKPIDISGLTADQDIPAELDLPWGVQALGEVRVRVDVEAALESRIFDGVPVVVLRGEGWEPAVTPAAVTLQGAAQALDSLARGSLAVLVHVPENARRSHYDVELGASEGPYMSVYLPEGSDLRATAVTPPVIGISHK